MALQWDRLPSAAFTVIPFLDCLAIGFTRQAGGPNFTVLSLMLVFPVVWLAIGRQRIRVVLAVVATLPVSYTHLTLPTICSV